VTAAGVERGESAGNRARRPSLTLRPGLRPASDPAAYL